MRFYRPFFVVHTYISYNFKQFRYLWLLSSLFFLLAVGLQTIAEELYNNYRDYLVSIEDKIREASLMVLDGNIPEDTIGNNITTI